MDATAADLAAIERDGYVVIERAVGPDVLDAIRAELAPYLEGGDDSYRGRNDFEGFDTNRVYGLLAKSPTEAELVTHPRVLAILDALLLPGYLLSANLAINLLPGETAQDIHFDDTFYKVPRPRPAIGVSAIWAIDDFTAANGATEVIPGSHRWGDGPPPPDAELVARRDAGRVGRRVRRAPCSTAAAPTPPTARASPSPRSTASRGPASRRTMMIVAGDAAADYPPVLQSLIGYSLYSTFMGHVGGRHPLKTLPAPAAARPARS